MTEIFMSARITVCHSKFYFFVSISIILYNKMTGFPKFQPKLMIFFLSNNNFSLHHSLGCFSTYSTVRAN